MNFALIGAGKMGTRWAGVLGDSLLAIVEPKTGTIALQDVLEASNIDAVIIATPHKFHASITEQALKAGKHVLCEKPGAISSKEIKWN